MRPFNFRSRDTTHCHQVVLVPGEESDGTTSTLGEAAFSPTTLNTAEAPALFCVRSKMSVPWGVTGEPRLQIPAWQSSTSATPFGVPAAPRHSPHKAQLQLGLGPTALVLSYYFVKLPECPWGMQAGKGKQGFFFFFFLLAAFHLNVNKMLPRKDIRTRWLCFLALFPKPGRA